MFFTSIFCQIGYLTGHTSFVFGLPQSDKYFSSERRVCSGTPNEWATLFVNLQIAVGKAAKDTAIKKLVVCNCKI